MVDKILDPGWIVQELFGNWYIFLAILMIFWIYVAAKYKFNIQLTAMVLISAFMLLMIVKSGFSLWIGVIVIAIAMGAAYVFWRYIKTT